VEWRGHDTSPGEGYRVTSSTLTAMPPVATDQTCSGASFRTSRNDGSFIDSHGHRARGQSKKEVIITKIVDQHLRKKSTTLLGFNHT